LKLIKSGERYVIPGTETYIFSPSKEKLFIKDLWQCGLSNEMVREMIYQLSMHPKNYKKNALSLRNLIRSKCNKNYSKRDFLKHINKVFETTELFSLCIGFALQDYDYALIPEPVVDIGEVRSLDYAIVNFNPQLNRIEAVKLLGEVKRTHSPYNLKNELQMTLTVLDKVYDKCRAPVILHIHADVEENIWKCLLLLEDTNVLHRGVKIIITRGRTFHKFEESIKMKLAPLLI